MGFLIPQDEMSIADIKALKAEVKAELLRRAVQQTGKLASDFVLRDIFPYEDFSGSTPTWDGVEWQNNTAITPADTFIQDVSIPGIKNRFVGFYGVIHHAVAVKAGGSPEGYVVSGVKYRSGTATVKEQVHLQKAHRWFYGTSGTLRVPVGFHKPVYYDDSETINTMLLSNTTIGAHGEELELLGIMCEPFGDYVTGDVEGRAPGNDSCFVPEDELTVDDIRNLRNTVKQTLLNIASKETGKPISDLVVRDIFPKDDLSFAGVEWQNKTAIGTANLWTNDFSQLLPKTQFVAFYGFDQASAVAGVAGWPYVAIKYGLGSAGATSLKVLHTQKSQKRLVFSVGENISARGYHDPVYYKGGDTIYLSYMAKATTTQYLNGVMPLGLLCEPFGSTIS